MKDSKNSVVFTKNSPIPGGHYSQGIIRNGFLFLSGQLPFIPSEPTKMLSTIEAQTKQVFENMKHIIHAAGADLEDVCKVTIYITDLSFWPVVNAIYSDFFGEAIKPARTTVPVSGLSKGFLIECDAVVGLKSSC